MVLYRLKIKNFRKLNNVEFVFGDATFLIGANNAGKSSTLDSIELLLSNVKLEPKDHSRYFDDEEEREIEDTSEIVIEGEFREVPEAILGERGFYRERLKKYVKDDCTDGYSFIYRVRLGADGKTHREMRMYTYDLKDEYRDCEKPQDFIDKGVDAAFFDGLELNKKLKATQMPELYEAHNDLFSVAENEEWFENPGGIASNVLSKLPDYLQIGTNVETGEIESKTGALQTILNRLFTTVRDRSANYKAAHIALEALGREMDSTDQTTDFGQMMQDLNHVVESVFPKSKINVDANLSNADVLKPTFDISMQSNVVTPVTSQGTGMIRSAIFALLRYAKQREAIDAPDRGLIIGFEEPELYLHPNAAENMRNIIYELSGGQTQVVCTTHSPYMIDISRNEKLVLKSFNITDHDYTSVFCFNHSEEFKKLKEDDKTRVKMVQKVDDYVSRVFFAQRVILVEGDTEDIIFKKTIEVMPDEARKHISDHYQIIKAVGKATMISFIKYLRAMNVDVFVVHDRDQGVDGAEVMNQPILDALDGDNTKRLMMEECVEDVLGYPAPSHDKPYKAYEHIKDWNTWDDVPDNWKEKMRIVFSGVAGL